MAVLGYNTIPASGNSLPGDFMFGNGPYTMTEDGTPTSMSIYITTTGSTQVRMCIYTGAGAPATFVDITDEVTVSATGWYTANVQHATPLTNATGYWLMVWTFGGINLNTDGGGDSDFDASMTYSATGDPPAYSTDGTGTNIIGIYVTYTPDAAATVPSLYVNRSTGRW